MEPALVAAWLPGAEPHAPASRKILPEEKLTYFYYVKQLTCWVFFCFVLFFLLKPIVIP
jgi:hypothetical protein